MFVFLSEHEMTTGEGVQKACHKGFGGRIGIPPKSNFFNDFRPCIADARASAASSPRPSSDMVDNIHTYQKGFENVHTIVNHKLV